jgi:NRAMP (natural resistance-associated macrophage protein)-like metal ion transporter
MPMPSTNDTTLIAKGRLAQPRHALNLLRKLGPGFITGVADDDPSAIATYSQAGAQFGTSMLWTTLLSYPLMAATQEISARVARVTGRGIADNMRKSCPRPLVHTIVWLILISNTINIGADLAGMGAAMTLFTGEDTYSLFPLLFGVGSVLAQVLLPYRRYAAVLKWLSISIFTYVGIVFFVRIPWNAVLHDTLIPQLQWTHGYWMMLVAVLGTTVSPYMFFWQAALELEEQRANPEERPLKRAPEQARRVFENIRLDTSLGMGVSNAVAYFIMLTTAIALHTHGVSHIETAAQAAEALRPIAGPLAFLLFTLGIVGTGLLAVPALAGSAAYALAEAMQWPASLNRKPGRARGFYFVMVGATLVGVGISLTHINPIAALVWSSIINGVISVPILATMTAMASSPKVMDQFVIPGSLRIAGWVTTAAMALCSAALLLELL